MDTWLEVEVWARLAPYQDPVATVATTETARRRGRKRGSLRLKGLGEVEIFGDGGDARRAVEGSGGISAEFYAVRRDRRETEKDDFCMETWGRERKGAGGYVRAWQIWRGVLSYCGEMRSFIMENVRLEIHDTGLRSITDHCAYQSIQYLSVIKPFTLAANPSSFFPDPPPRELSSRIFNVSPSVPLSGSTSS